eukprot:TRINITY_DN2029_c0_g1_i1.p1 TRINITY_DN2029_c0_g1~~TRINITY_DN2029_c0_g1_i1.p1  ORF type:complete len:450 (-),score=56.53 TRINITY_DN2029_c0_g1_i1:811-2160(-)
MNSVISCLRLSECVDAIVVKLKQCLLSKISIYSCTLYMCISQENTYLQTNLLDINTINITPQRKNMHKLFLLEGDSKSEPLEVLTFYIMPVLKAKANVVILTPKEQKFLHLETLPCLLRDDTLVTDYEKIIFTVCQLAGVDSLILKKPEIWPLAETFLPGKKDIYGKPLLDRLNAILVNKTFLTAVHITLADIFAAVPAIRSLLEHPVEKQLEWLHVYRWAEYLQNLPHIGTILAAKGGILKPLAMIQAKPKEEEKGKPKKGKVKEKAKKEPDVPPFSQLDLRVGKIVKVQKHSDSVKLYIEEVDIGGEIRKIASGLQEYVKIEEMQDKNVVVFCNLKPKKMAGYPSHGMVLCASNDDHTKVELLSPPEGTKPGDVLTVEGLERKPAADINLSRDNNPWNKVVPKLSTNEELILTFEGKPVKTSLGPIKAKTMKAAHISQTCNCYRTFH